ncbi:caspase family protein [Methylosinus sp. PW1]|uniref:caspase family protein n=1 Tax=Methylosinus sp. PW1 TaxID=107636 RepID=UPI00055B5E77|nr:caspase family protein [Methylosinus sp. PW1]
MRTRFFDVETEGAAEIAASSSDDAPEPAAASHGLRFALVVGNSRYPAAPLANAGRDAAFVGKALADLGFAVTTLRDATRAAVVAAVASFMERVEAAGPDAAVIFYFAGHGMRLEDAHYLAPVDMDPSAPNEFALRALALDDIIASFTRRRRRVTTLVLDACRLRPRDAPGRDAYTGGMADLRLNREGVMVIWSTSAGTAASDGESGVGPYAEALVAALPGLLVRGRPAHDVFAHANDLVARATEGRQVPAIYMHGALAPLLPERGDARRLETWASRRPFGSWARDILAKLAMLGAAAAITAAVSAWVAAYPETRRAWLAQVGLARSDADTYACREPWDEIDAYGLSRRDWCTLGPKGILDLFERRGRPERLVDEGVADGDPKAFVLKVTKLVAGVPNRAAPSFKEAYDLSERAARTDLPAGRGLPLVIHRLLDDLSDTFFTIDTRRERQNMRLAADHGYTPAMAMLAAFAASAGDEQEFDMWIEKAAAITADGSIEFKAFEQRRLQTNRTGLPASDAVALRWLWRSIARDNPIAISQILTMAERDPSLVDNRRRADLLAILIDKGPTLGRYWRAHEFLRTNQQDVLETSLTIADLVAAAEDHVLDAAGILGDLYMTGRVGGARDLVKATEWFERAAADGDTTSMGRLALLAFEERPPRPEAIAAASFQGRRMVEHGDSRGSFVLAEIAMRGLDGHRDPLAARRLYEAAGADPRARSLAEDAIRRIDLESKALALGDPSSEIATGSVDAPTTVIVYMPYVCAPCASIFDKLIQPLADRYAASGQMRLILRSAWGEGNEHYESLVVTAARCAVPERRFEALLRVSGAFRAWRENGAGKGVGDAIVDAMEGVPRARPLADCIEDAPAKARLRQDRDFIVGAFGVAALPFAIVNGSPIGRATLEDVERLIQSARGPAAEVSAAIFAVMTP